MPKHRKGDLINASTIFLLVDSLVFSKDSIIDPVLKNKDSGTSLILTSANMLMKLYSAYIFIMFLLTTASLNAQSDVVTVYSEEIQHALDDFRTIALEKPDSCEAAFDAVYKTALRTKEYHAIAKAQNIRGIGYAYKNDIPKAIEYFLKANNIAEKLPPTDILVDSRNNIANMYISQGDSVNALKYFNLGMEAAILYGNLDRELITRIQLTSLEIDCGKLESAFDNLEKIRAQYDQITELDVKAYYHIARCRYFYENEMYDSSLVHAETALHQYESLHDAIGISTCNYYVGMNHLKAGNVALAITHCQTSYNVADTSGLSIWQQQSCECLWQANVQKGDYQKALEYHVKMTELSEQTKNDERIRDITKLEMEVSFTKTRLQDSLKIAEENMRIKSEQELAIQEEKSKNVMLYAGLGFMAIIAFVLYRSIRSKKRDNLIILEQKNTVEQKQLEIMDSIACAKRLQEAILPSESQINKALPDHFIFYAPKDIVSGDFYWLESFARTTDSEEGNKVADSDGERTVVAHSDGEKTVLKDSVGKEISALESKRENVTKKSGVVVTETITLLAAADCTGHGVPGAMVSVVCSNALRRSVREFGLTKPGEILDKVSSIVIETFENDRNEVKDGMDVALIALKQKPDSEIILEYSGANNPLWIVRHASRLDESKKHDSTLEFDENNQMAMIEVKADRQPVGRFADKKPFQTTSLNLEKGDTVYIFTDGFPDQFGGPKGKKFKYQTFKRLLLEHAHLAMQEQRKVLADTLVQWQREFEQTDDICVIGVRI